jgi:hypothetical protein
VIWRIGGALILAVLFLAIAQRALFGPAPQRSAVHAAAGVDAPVAAQPAPAGCETNPALAAAARDNATSLQGAEWSVFGRLETGWQAYAPLVVHELRIACPPQSEAFAGALAAWQASRRLPASGEMDEATLRALNLAWLMRRPFVAVTAHGHCPDPPPPEDLAAISPDEGYLGQPARLRPAALAAYRRMVAAARAENPAIAADPKLLSIFSGYRDPAADAAACALQHACGTPARAGTCSAHRTGLAVDLYLGSAPGYPPESSADPNRVFQSRSAAYAWMVGNAGRFGFVNYPFEPWHWEWTGEPP